MKRSNQEPPAGYATLMRDHLKKEVDPTKPEEPKITSLNDIIENKPSIKEVRKYYRKVLENIDAEDDGEFK